MRKIKLGEKSANGNLPGYRAGVFSSRHLAVVTATPSDVLSLAPDHGEVKTYMSDTKQDGAVNRQIQALLSLKEPFPCRTFKEEVGGWRLCGWGEEDHKQWAEENP